MAAMVPTGIARLGSFRSPDMFTPAMIPVTAGKNTANTVQNDSDRAADALNISISVASSGFPKTREISEMAMAVMITYWARTATCADFSASSATRIVTTMATACWSMAGNVRFTLSANPTV